jgi:hypothetical protein
MKYSIDLDRVRIRESKVEGFISSHLKEKYANMIVNVKCNTHTYSWVSVVEFDFIVDVDYGRHDGPDSFYNRRIRKEISNLCKYILGERESLGNTHFNSVIHAVL